jgi:acyl-CoA synthetase
MSDLTTAGIRRPVADLEARYRSTGMWSTETLGELIARCLDAHPSQSFVFHSASGDYRGKIADVAERAWRIATALGARGVAAGDVVAIQLPNGIDAVACFCAAALAGATVVPIVYYYGASETEYIVAATGARVLLTAEDSGRHGSRIELAAHLLEAQACLELVVVAATRSHLPSGMITLDELVGEGSAVGRVIAVDPTRPALVAFTSGTTAAPKGVVHSHETLCFEARQFAATVPAGRPIMMGAPVSHVLGLLSGVLAPLVNGEPIHLLDGWNPGQVLDAMLTERLRAGSGPPVFLTTLLDDPRCSAGHLELIDPCRLGGAPVPEALVVRAAQRGVRVLRIYGLTEHPSVASGNLDDPQDKVLRTTGRPLDGCEVKIAADGEIVTRGPDLCIGYTDPSLTVAAFDADGWFYTGDIGSLDADGYLTILDRKKDLIIRGGENISALEVEEHLGTMPGITEVAIVAAPDARLGEVVAAFVKMVDGSRPPELEEVQAHCRGRGLARHKWPQYVEAVVEFPRTPSGKVLKPTLRERLASGA